jgi:hypothetical protein
VRARWWTPAAGLLVAAVVGALAYLGAIPGVKGRYPNSDPALAVAFRAKETCSCLFVEGRDEAYCRAWTQVHPDLARVEVDARDRSVLARALLLWSARARHVDARRGCVLE